MKKYTWLIVLLVVVLLVGGWVASNYNSLVSMQENIANQQAQVDNQYQRRFDLIPNLVNSVQGIFNQEQEVFGKLADARPKYAGTQAGTQERVAATNEVETALSRLLVVVENYPELRSAENVTRLMDELAGTENRIAVERSRYNDTVNEYNKKIRVFPSNLAAAVFGFEAATRYEVAEEAKAVPAVDFN